MWILPQSWLVGCGAPTGVCKSGRFMSSSTGKAAEERGQRDGPHGPVTGPPTGQPFQGRGNRAPPAQALGTGREVSSALVARPRPAWRARCRRGTVLSPAGWAPQLHVPESEAQRGREESPGPHSRPSTRPGRAAGSAAPSPAGEAAAPNGPHLPSSQGAERPRSPTPSPRPAWRTRSPRPAARAT